MITVPRNQQLSPCCSIPCRVEAMPSRDSISPNKYGDTMQIEPPKPLLSYTPFVCRLLSGAREGKSSPAMPHNIPAAHSSTQADEAAAEHRLDDSPPGPTASRGDRAGRAPAAELYPQAGG